MRVSERQLPMVADHQPVALVVLAKAYVGAGGWDWEPMAYERQGDIVAVLGLAHDGETTHVINLAVDERHQSTGVGTAVMAEVRNHVRMRGTTLLTLTVHPDNDVAAALYNRAGFRPTGAVHDGEPVWDLTV